MRKGEFGDELLLDVNPQYDWHVDPHDQPEFTNPVQVNNKLIVLANAVIRVTQGIATLQKESAEKKRRKRELLDAVETIEQAILKECPPSATQVKTLKAQAAYISSQAHALGHSEPLLTAKKELASLEDDIDILELRLKTAKAWVDAIKLQGENLKTFLSYAKFERTTSGYGT